MIALVYVPQSTLLTYHDLRYINPHFDESTSDSILNARGIYRLQYADKPKVGAYQQLVEIAPTTPINGLYYHTYLAVDMFPNDTIDENGNTVTIQQQKDAYDQSRLMQLKETLSKAVDNAYDDSLAQGVIVTLPDTTQGTLDITLTANLKRLLADATTTPTKTLPLREGPVEVTSSQYATINQTALQTVNAIENTLVSQQYALSTLTTLTDANAFEPTQGFPVHIEPRTISLLVDVDDTEIEFVNNPDNESTNTVGMRPAGPGKGYVNLSSLTWLSTTTRIKSVNGIRVPEEGLFYNVVDSNDTLTARLYFNYRSTVIEADCIANGLPVTIPNIVVSYS